MKKTFFLTLFLLSCVIAFNQTYRKFDINDELNNGFISETHTPFDLGSIQDAFDDNFNSLVRCQPVNNPMIITLAFDTVVSVGASRILSAQPATWIIEGAMTQSDLDDQTGTYSSIANGQVYIDNIYDSTGFATTELKYIRLTLERTTPDYYTHLREWEIYYVIPPVQGDYALQFDGMNDQVNTSLYIDQSSGITSYTFEAWVYPTSVSSGRHMVISTDNGNYDWSILREGSTWFVFNGSNSINTGFSVDINQWQHIAAVFIPGTGVRFYKNGAEVILSEISLESSYNPITIAENPGSAYQEFFTGVIDEVRVWGTARTQSEIQSFMTTKDVEAEPGLISVWHFDEGTGTTTLDSKGIYDGTLTNGPIWVTNVAPLLIDGHDLNIIDISSPVSGCFEETDQPVTITVRNSGSFDESAFDLTYIFENDTITESISDILLESNGLFHYTFSYPIDIPAYGVYNLKAYVQMTGDEVPENDTLNYQFEYSEPFEYELSADDTICYGDSKTLAVSGGDHYRWSTGSTSIIISVSPLVSQYYGITVYGAGEGCYYEDSVYVHVAPAPEKPVISSENNTACIGDTLSLTSSVKTNIRWSTGKYTPSIDVTGSGGYTVTHTGEYGCSSVSNPYDVNFMLKPYISAVMNTICRDDTLMLNAYYTSSCTWSTGESSLSIKVSPQTATTYYLDAYNTPGCHNTDSFDVFVTDPVPVEPAYNLLPSDSSLLLDPPVYFSWLPGENSVLHDIYVWLDGFPRPSTPFRSNMDYINLRYNAYLMPDTLYNWQIISKNSCSEAESDTQTFSIVSPPDLTVDSIDVPKTAHTGASFSVSWVSRNIGGPTKKYWCDAVYLSEDKILDPTDIYVGLKSSSIYLDNNESYRQSAEFILPKNLVQGYYYTIIKLNHTTCKYLYEPNKENNTKASDSLVHVLLTPPPDLQVMPDIAVPADAFSSQDIGITYRIKNYGTGPTREKLWRDYVYLSSSPDRSLSDGVLLGKISHSGILEDDSTYSNILTASLPQGISGSYYIHIITDFEDDVYEFAYEENNWRVSDSISVMLLPPPDLIVEEIRIPDRLNIGETYDIHCIFKNNGFGSTTENSWYDSIFFSIQSDNLTDLNPLLGVKHNGIVDLGGSYNVSFPVIIPSVPDTSHFFVVKTDAGNKVFEYNNEDNNSYARAINIMYPDLTIEIDNLPDTVYSGEIAWLNYQINNDGLGKLINQTRIDGFYITSVPNTSSGNKLTESAGKQIIGVNDSVDLTVPLNIPNGISGTYYFYAKTDLPGIIYEKPDEDNNTSNISNPVYVKLSPVVDLSIIGVMCEDTITAGEEVSISWIDKNSGEGTAKPNWIDKIYLSETSNLDTTNAILLNSTLVKDSLLPSEYIQMSYSYKSDYWLSGTYYILVSCDAENQVYEHNNENNNLLNKKIVVNPYPPIDLTTDTVISPSSGWSGEKVNMRYIVKNVGSGKTLVSSWYDMIYLSEDMNLSANDIQLTPKNKHSGPLDPGSEYIKTLNVSLPDGLSGEYYFIVETDWELVVYDNDRTNNTSVSIPINIALSPSPDILIDSVSTPIECTAGQPDTVYYKISNIGQADVGNVVWYDYIYLSIDPDLNYSDKIIGRYQHTDSLLIGENEYITCPVEIPVSASGNYYIIVFTDCKNTLYEHKGEDNNISTNVTSVYLPPPSDLIVDNIFSGISTIVGDSCKFYWNTVNQGENNARGRTQENIYLSADENWDVNDALVAEISKKIDIAPGSYQADSFKARVPGVKPDNYYIIVRTDITNRIPEDIETNNTGISLATIDVDMKELNPGSSSSTMMIKNLNYFYKINIHDSLSGEILSIKLNNTASGIQGYLFASYDKIPDNANYDFSSDDPFSGNQEIIIPNIIPGTYYIKASYQGTVPNQQATISATILPFQIDKINTDIGGNSGQVTVKITGSKFTHLTTFGLKSENQSILPKMVQNIDLLNSFVTFDLLGKPNGLYDVYAANPDGDTTWLNQGFEITEGQNTGLSLNLQHPASTRGTQIIRVSLDFANLSNVDISAPVVRLTSTGGSPIALSLDALKSGNGVTELILTLEEQDGPEGILRAKQGGSLTIYCSSSPAPSFMVTQIK